MKYVGISGKLKKLCDIYCNIKGLDEFSVKLEQFDYITETPLEYNSTLC